VYIVNLMTKRGETGGYTASQHVEAIAKYAGRVPDAVLVHRGPIPEELAQRYRAEQAERVIVDKEKLLALGVPLIRPADMMSSTSLVRHDPERTAAALLDLFDDLAADAPDYFRSSIGT
jgi:uncharacterized cofD-like protein